MKANELQPRLEALNTKMTKIITEIETLKSSLEDVELPAEATASLERLEGLTQKADDENADAPVPEPPPAPNP